MLSINRFSKSYNDQLVLSVNALTLLPGIHWIKGENGSGKSTLFKAIAGLIPFDGEIQLNNYNLKKNACAYRKLVNYSEAEPLYPGFLTPKDLVRFIGSTKGSPLKQQEYFADVFGIKEYYEKTFETFSSGMLKKVSLAIAFLGMPKVIILDEPLITLDIASRKILFDIISESLKNEIIFLISSHQTIDDLNIPITNTYTIANKTITLA